MAISVAFLCSGFLYEELKRYSICILIVSRFLEVVKDTTEIFSKKFAHLHLILNRGKMASQNRLEDLMMKLTYTEKNGLLYPDLTLPEQPNYAIGKYGRMRLDYLKQHRRGTYGNLKAQAKLNQHLHEIDVQASELLESIVSELAKKNNINEELKAKDQIRWVQEMNAIKACAEEIVLQEVVYQ